MMKELYQSKDSSVEFYDVHTTNAPGSPTHGDLAFYLAQTRKTGGPVLELGAGTGRAAIHIAKAGFNVTGLDMSPYMLAQARSKLTPELKKHIQLVKGNMARFNLRRKFKLVFIAFRSFQHLLTPNDQLSCLKCIKRHLAANGLFIVNIFDPKLKYILPDNPQAPMARESVTHPTTGNKVEIRITNRKSDPFKQIFSEDWNFIERTKTGKVLKRRKERLTLRWTYRYEMEYLLKLAGFKILACYGDFKKGPPRYGAEQIWVCKGASRH
ncbi:class I SAM-dependent DNA methyltransferase [Elusimicrobiota bacterium]